MYGIFTYIWLIFMVNVGKTHHTWMVWDTLPIVTVRCYSSPVSSPNWSCPDLQADNPPRGPG